MSSSNGDADIFPVPKEDQSLSPWQPMSKPIDIKHMSKLIEEFGEACAIVGRCMAQGIDECDPDTGQVNSKDLQDELADVQANIDLVVEHFRLDSDYMNTRKETKKSRLKKWHSALS